MHCDVQRTSHQLNWPVLLIKSQQQVQQHLGTSGALTPSLVAMCLDAKRRKERERKRDEEKRDVKQVFGNGVRVNSVRASQS